VKNYSGNPNNITTELTATVNSCASGSGGFVLVGTTSAHNFATNDFVTVAGVVGTTEANTTAQITVVDPTHFLLNGVTFVHGYVSGGVARDLSLTPYFSLPDDGEAGTAESIEASIEALADRTQFLQLKGYVRSQTFTTSTTWTSPVDGFALLVGYGGGGGGGGGYGNGTSTSTFGVGGGGGGGSLQSAQIVPIIKGTLYDVIIGAGGAGGTGGAAGNNNGSLASAGGDTVLRVDATSFVLARFTGAGGGFGAGFGVVGGASDPGHMTWGGAAIKATDTAGNAASLGSASDFVQSVTSTQAVSEPIKSIASGGFGTSNDSSINANSRAGSFNPVGFADGTGRSLGGAGGTNAAFQFGGGGGGGGGNGPGGLGANGGAGGNGSASTATAGSVGLTASTNSGAGGGGGGAGGTGAIAGGTGGNGGTGGSGQLMIMYIGSLSQ